MKCTTPWWDSRAATTRLTLHQRDRGKPVFTDGSHVHQDTRGYDLSFAGEHWAVEEPNVLFDFTSSYYDIDIHRGDSAGTTVFVATGYGFDLTGGGADNKECSSCSSHGERSTCISERCAMAEDPSETAGDVSSYLCQWKMLTGDLHEQSVGAHLPYSTTKVKCTTPWWDSRGSTTRLSVHQRDRGNPVFTDGSHVHQDTRGYDLAFAGEHWAVEEPNVLFDFTSSYYDIDIHRGDSAGTTVFVATGYGFDLTGGGADNKACSSCSSHGDRSTCISDRCAMADEPSETAGDVSSYLCQWKMLTGA